jgi:hypothetical protein
MISKKNVIIVGVGMLVATSLAVVIWKRADSELRSQLLQQAKIIAASLNVHQINSLTGADADINSVWYQRLKEQLGSIRATRKDCRFLYLMKKNVRNQIVFMVDSEPPDSEDYSPPGQIFTEAESEIYDVFYDSQPRVTGPETDRWGTWVTALVPVTDISNNEIVAIMGMDVGANDWLKQTFLNAIQGNIIMILAIVFMGAFLSLYLSRKRARR